MGRPPSFLRYSVPLRAIGSGTTPPPPPPPDPDPDPEPPPPGTAPAELTVRLRANRWDDGSGVTVQKNAIPLRPGDLFSHQVPYVRLVEEVLDGNGVAVDGATVPVWVHALRGRHRDGSLRSVYIEFTPTAVLSKDTPVADRPRFRLRIGATLRTVAGSLADYEGHPESVLIQGLEADGVTPKWTDSLGYWYHPPGSALPFEPEYLCETELCFYPQATEAQILANGTDEEIRYHNLHKQGVEWWFNYHYSFGTGPNARMGYRYGLVFSWWNLWCATGDPNIWLKASMGTQSWDAYYHEYTSGDGAARSSAPYSVTTFVLQVEHFWAGYSATGQENFLRPIWRWGAPSSFTESLAASTARPHEFYTDGRDLGRKIFADAAKLNLGLDGAPPYADNNNKALTLEQIAKRYLAIFGSSLSLFFVDPEAGDVLGNPAYVRSTTVGGQIVAANTTYADTWSPRGRAIGKSAASNDPTPYTQAPVVSTRSYMHQMFTLGSLAAARVTTPQACPILAQNATLGAWWAEIRSVMFNRHYLGMRHHNDLRWFNETFEIVGTDVAGVYGPPVWNDQDRFDYPEVGVGVADRPPMPTEPFNDRWSIIMHYINYMVFGLWTGDTDLLGREDEFQHLLTSQSWANGMSQPGHLVGYEASFAWIHILHGIRSGVITPATVAF